MIQGVNTIIDGVQLLKGTGVVQGQSLTQAVPFAKVGDTAKNVQAGMYVNSTPIVCFKSAVARVSSVTDCHLTGSVFPIGMEVSLSKVSSMNPALSELQNRRYEHLVPDSDGTWAIDAPAGYDGLVAAWIQLEADSLSVVQNADVSIVAHQEEPIIPSGAILTYEENVPVTVGAGGCEITFDYTCPDDVVMIDMYDLQYLQCGTCSGAGSVGGTVQDLCPACNGSGTNELGDECPSCAGTGYVETPAQVVCPTCDGAGYEPFLVDSIAVKGGVGSATVVLAYISTSETRFRWSCSTADLDGTLGIANIICNAICLSGDTLITLADGTSRRLDELMGDELVLGGDMQPARILRIARGTYSPKHTLYHFEDGTVIDETHEHRFFNNEQGFWQKLKNWRMGDRAQRLDGGTPALVAVEPVEERAEMFGMWVDRGSYWANGLLSGDASANQSLLSDATAEQAADMAASLAERDLMRMLGLEGLLP